jgi:5-methyltetrahydropteroyltriglutamate--homocysteine methyltransferase
MSITVYRAQTIGSMLRPQFLREARRAHRRGDLSAADFKGIEDQAVDQALALQERAGIALVTDGEQRRASFVGSLIETTEGLTRSMSVTKPWHNDDDEVEQLSLGLVVSGKLRRRRSLVAEEFAYARARTRLPIKVALPSPMMLAMFWSPTESRAAYRDPFELFIDGAEVIRAEIAELARMGCTEIQIDAPELAIIIDPEARQAAFEAYGVEPQRMLAEGVELLDALADTPGVNFGLHLCRGNNDGRWLSRGGYDSIAHEVFRRAHRYSSFMLEYDDERSGGFAPLAQIPSDKIVVLGLVSTKRPALETVDGLLGRIGEAVRYFPREQLALSPQCGFASGIAGNPIDAAAEEAKLRLVGEVAHRAWG